MQEVEAKLRKWGRSIGAVIPKNVVKLENLREGDSVKLIVLKKNNVLKETFGTLKFRKSTDEILNDIDKKGWNE